MNFQPLVLPSQGSGTTPLDESGTALHSKLQHDSRHCPVPYDLDSWKNWSHNKHVRLVFYVNPMQSMKSAGHIIATNCFVYFMDVDSIHVICKTQWERTQNQQSPGIFQITNKINLHCDFELSTTTCLHVCNVYTIKFYAVTVIFAVAQREGIPDTKTQQTKPTPKITHNKNQKGFSQKKL